VKEIIEFDLDPSEKEALKESAKVVREQIIRGQVLLKMVNPSTP
jgi:malate/lactate dehydrogenase